MLCNNSVNVAKVSFLISVLNFIPKIIEVLKEAVTFLVRVKELLENPIRLMLSV